MVAVIGPEGHLALSVMNGMQRPPPTDAVLQPMAPILTKIQDQDIEEKGNKWRFA